MQISETHPKLSDSLWGGAHEIFILNKFSSDADLGGSGTTIENHIPFVDLEQTSPHWQHLTQASLELECNAIRFVLIGHFLQSNLSTTFSIL